MPPEQVETVAPAPLGRDAIVSQLNSLGDPAEVEADPDEPAAPVADEAAPEEAAVDADPVEEDADADTDEAESTDEEKVDDPKAQKGLDAVRRAEKRHRAQMDADRAEFARERAQHTEALSKVADYEAAAKRIAHDPIALLAKLGVPKSAYEVIAHAIFAESETGAKDPVRAAQAAQRLRDREKEDKLTAAEKRMEAIEAKIEADKLERQQAADTERYIGEINTTAKAKYPLIAHMMTASPEDVGDGLSAAFDRLKAKTGKDPRPVEVVAEMDRKERTRLKALGVDPDALIGKKAATATVKAAAAKVNGHTKPASANAPKSRDEILAELDSLSP